MVSEERVRVFLSYRRSDTQHAAGRAADKLADRYELFMDIDTIPPGVDFTDYLRRAVGGCDVLVAFIGEGWATAVDARGQRRLDDPGDWVASEIDTALSRGIPVIPVLVDAAALPEGDTLPDRLRPMLSRQTAPLRFESFTADLNHLVAAIDHSARRRQPEVAVAQAPVTETAFADRWQKEPAARPRTPAALAVPAVRRRVVPAVALGIAIVALAGAGSWFLFGQRSTAAVPPEVAPNSSQVPPSALPTIPPATSVAALKARVPEQFRSTCRKLTPTDPLLTRDLVVAIQCTPTQRGRGARPEFAFYFQYPTATSAAAAFRGYYAGSAPGQGDCTGEPGEVPDERSPATDSGVLRCYRDVNDYAVLAWISPEQAIVASAADRNRSLGELFAWWDSAGPTAR